LSSRHKRFTNLLRNYCALRKKLLGIVLHKIIFELQYTAYIYQSLLFYLCDDSFKDLVT
jgi:hypothetical protein